MPTETLYRNGAAIIDVPEGSFVSEELRTVDDEGCSIACTLIPCCGTD